MSTFSQTQVQPSHTVYGGAHLFKPGLAEKLTSIAVQTMKSVDSTAQLPFRAEIWQQVLVRGQSPLGLVEDFRIDFEDGYGVRSDEEEDADAQRAGGNLAQYLLSGTYAGRYGLRIKDLERHQARAFRTFDLFCEALVTHLGNRTLKAPLVVTVPKVRTPAKIAELTTHLAARTLPIRLEIMIEDPAGLVQVAESCLAAGSLLGGVHFGPFDFLAQCGLNQGDLHHPLAQRAKQDILLTVKGRVEPLLQGAVELSDGPTTRLPIRPHRECQTAQQQKQNDQALIAAWSEHKSNIHQSLSQGYSQSWILHPAQLVSLHCSLAEIYSLNLRETVERLGKFQNAQQQATRSSQEFDDSATIRVLVNRLRRAISYGVEVPPQGPQLLDYFADL